MTFPRSRFPARTFPALVMLLLGTGRASPAVADSQTNPASVADGSGGVIMAWEEIRGGTTKDIYLVCLDSGGLPRFPAVAVCTATRDQRFPGIVSDGAGGAIVAWEDNRSVVSNIYAQRVLASGVVDPAWPANGLVLCAASGAQSVPILVSDGAGGAIVVWEDYRAGGSDVYAHRALASGSVDPAWPLDGLALCSLGGHQNLPEATSDGAGGAIVTWQDYRSAGIPDIYVQRVLVTGLADAAWPANGLALCTAIGAQTEPAIASDGAGGAIVAWTDARNVTGDIYAQRVLPTGVVDPAWPVNGITLCGAQNVQAHAAIVPTGPGAAIVVWEDDRNLGGGYGTFTHAGDIYAHRVTTSGVDPVWSTNGRAVIATTGYQRGPVPVPDGAGGVIVKWEDSRSGDFDVYAQRLSAAGAVAWTRTLCATAGEQRESTIVPDGAGGAIVAWEDHRDVSPNLYAARVTMSGSILWTPQGLTPTLLSVESAEAEPGTVRITWHTEQDGLEAALYRAEEGSRWTYCTTLVAEADGRLRYVDHAVAAGRRYGYRLGMGSGADETYIGEVWLTIPGRDAFRLDGLVPNPAPRDLIVAFSLAEPGDARLELMDVAGRNLITRRLTGLRLGDHVLNLGEGRSLPAGVYWIRLTQAGRSLTRRAVVAR